MAPAMFVHARHQISRGVFPCTQVLAQVLARYVGVWYAADAPTNPASLFRKFSPFQTSLVSVATSSALFPVTLECHRPLTARGSLSDTLRLGAISPTTLPYSDFTHPVKPTNHQLRLFQQQIGVNEAFFDLWGVPAIRDAPSGGARGSNISTRRPCG